MNRDIGKRARCYASSQKPFGDKTDLILGYENGATEQKAIDIDKFKSKLKSILIIAQDPTMHQERKEMEILAMIQNSLEE